MNCITFDTNLIGGQTSQYSNFSFNSMAKFGHRYLLANKLGLFMMEGYTDGSAPVASEFTLGPTDFGTTNKKYVYAIYARVDTSDGFTISVTVDDKTTREYEFSASKAGPQGVRIRIGRKLNGVYWTFKISSSAYLAVDSIDILPRERHARHI